MGNQKKNKGRSNTQSSVSRRNFEFQVGSWVYVTLPCWDGETSNLRAGPYKIAKQVGDDFGLEMWTNSPSKRSGVYPIRVFNASRLSKARNDIINSRSVNKPTNVVIDTREEWEVEKILNSRIDKDTGRLLYQAKWTGYDEDLKWYSAGGFKHATQRLLDFHSQFPMKPGPPKNLGDWVERNSLEEDIISNDGDDFPREGRLARSRRRNKRAPGS